MGWFVIKNIETGQMVMPPKFETNTEKEFWSGDDPLDIMDEAIKKIIISYHIQFGRIPYKEELQSVFNLCFNGYNKYFDEKKFETWKENLDQLTKEKLGISLMDEFPYLFPSNLYIDGWEVDRAFEKIEGKIKIFIEKNKKLEKLMEEKIDI